MKIFCKAHRGFPTVGSTRHLANLNSKVTETQKCGKYGTKQNSIRAEIRHRSSHSLTLDDMA